MYVVGQCLTEDIFAQKAGVMPFFTLLTRSIRKVATEEPK